MRLSPLYLGLSLLLAGNASLAQVATVINDAELREKPALDAKQRVKVESKTRVTVIDTRGAWVEVKTPNGERGWLRLMNIRPGEQKHWTEKVSSSVGSVGAVARTASTGTTATTGVKGISKEELANATPNFDEVKLLDRFQVSAAEARKFAGESKIKPQKVAVLKEEDDVAKQ